MKLPISVNTLCFYTNENDLEERKKLILRESEVIAGTVASNSQDGLGLSEKAKLLISISENMRIFSGEQFRI